MLGFDELAKALGVSRRQITAWIKEGLPHSVQGRRKMFAPAEVAQWLRQKGYAETEEEAKPETIASTKEEAARLLGVSTRTLSDWQKQPGFPGEPGRPGRRVAYYPIERIQQWRETNVDDEGDSTVRQEIERLKLLEKQIELEKLVGTIVDAEEVDRFLQRVVATAKSMLDSLPDKVVAVLPAKTTETTRRAVRAAVESDLREVFSVLGELIEGDRDDEVDGAN